MADEITKAFLDAKEIAEHALRGIAAVDLRDDRKSGAAKANLKILFGEDSSDRYPQLLRDLVYQIGFLLYGLPRIQETKNPLPTPGTV